MLPSWSSNPTNGGSTTVTCAAPPELVTLQRLSSHMNIYRTFAFGAVLFFGLSAHVGLALPAVQNDSSTQASPTQPSTQTNPPDKAEDKKTAEEKEREIQKQEQSQRMLKTLRNFATTNRREPPPLTPAQKFHLFRKS